MYPACEKYPKQILIDIKQLDVNEVNKVRRVSHLVVELWALVVVQDGCVCTADEERVSWFAIDALKKEASVIGH